jgi:C4-type Zn-finger protein
MHPILSYRDDEIAHEKKVQCPVCAQRYGYVAMNKGAYQVLQRVTDKVLQCLICGYRQIKE